MHRVTLYHMHNVTESTIDYNLRLFSFSFTGVSSHISFSFFTFSLSLPFLLPSGSIDLAVTFLFHSLIDLYFRKTLEGKGWSTFFLALTCVFLSFSTSPSLSSLFQSPSPAL
jgi:hypothetical protein